MSPKKPNSGNRRTAKVRLFYIDKNIKARIIGNKFFPTKFNQTLVQGGRANDVPGVNYSLIRGVLDFRPLFEKKRRRSIYGVKRFFMEITVIRRKFRKYNEYYK